MTTGETSRVDALCACRKQGDAHPYVCHLCVRDGRIVRLCGKACGRRHRDYLHHATPLITILRGPDAE